MEICCAFRIRIRGEGRHAWRRQKAGGRSRLRVVAMEEVDMDIDEEDEVASRQASCASSSSSSSAMDWLETPAYWTGWGTRSLDQKRRVHVIVDTNVLVDPESLEALRSTAAGIVERSPAVSFLFPWTVLAELDGLKKSKDENKRAHARRAMLFVEAVLTRSSGSSMASEDAGHVAYFGQSLQEFKEAAAEFGVRGVRHSNDDLILQCTLQRQRRGDRVALLTGDRNLLIKARACGVPAFRALLAEDVAAVAAMDPVPSSSSAEEARTLPSSSPSSPPPRRQVALTPDQVAEHTGAALGLLEVALSKFVEATFRENFGAQGWRDMVSVPPPWTLTDLLGLAKQHWFSLGVERGDQEALDLVAHVLERQGTSGGAALPKQTFLMFVDKSAGLFDGLLSGREAERAEMGRLRGRVYAG